MLYYTSDRALVHFTSLMAGFEQWKVDWKYMFEPASHGGFLYVLVAADNSTLYQTAISKWSLIVV